MFRTICGGGKGGGSAYDPQIGLASQMTASTAARAQEFSEKYYNDVITPLLQQQSKAAMESQGKLNTIYDLNADQMRTARDRYEKYGIPAEEKYYNMVQEYSAPEYAERAATEAKGDLGVAMGNQRATMSRQMASLGIDPTSPAAISAAGDMTVLNAAAEAGAMNRARNAARDMGMKLTSDAANFGRGGQSGILQFGNAASGNATGAFGIANAALGTGMQAGNSVQQGYQTAMSGYNNIMDNYTKLGTADIQAQAASGLGAGVGSLAGGLLGGASKPWIFSDRRLKVNVEIVGQLPSGLNVYEFNYVWGGERQRGVMAQEVLHVQPEAVAVGGGGYLTVDYGMVR